jgi:hypothetical protein
MSDQWGPNQIYRAWEQIRRAVVEAMKPLPRQTLVFLARRASDGIVRATAAELIDWQDHRHLLPDFGWSVAHNREHPRCSRRAVGIASA